MDHLRTEIWDSLYYSGPQTIAQIAEKLRLNHVTVSGVIDHEWFALRGDTVAIAAKADSAAVHGSRES